MLLCSYGHCSGPLCLVIEAICESLNPTSHPAWVLLNGLLIPSFVHNYYLLVGNIIRKLKLAYTTRKNVAVCWFPANEQLEIPIDFSSRSWFDCQTFQPRQKTLKHNLIAAFSNNEISNSTVGN